MSNNPSGTSPKEAVPNATHATSPESRGERRLLSPFRCRLWTQHARPEDQLTEHACKSLRESIAKNGQHQPALARPVTDDSDYDVEIICGARRHAASLALGRDLLVEVRPISDSEAYLAMYEENVERKDDCPYVQGQILRRALSSGTCSSQEELGRVFKLSHSKVSRLLMVAQLPSVIVAAFQSPRDIRESWGVELYQLWKANDPEHAIANRARSLAHKQRHQTAREVYEALLTTRDSRCPQPRLNRSIPIRGSTGVVLFREKDQIESVTFIVPKVSLSTKLRANLKDAMISVLDSARSPPRPFPTEASDPASEITAHLSSPFTSHERQRLHQGALTPSTRPPTTKGRQHSD